MITLAKNNNMKINWGHKLVFFTVLFMVFVVSMVYFMISQKVELVETDYYEKGMNYQKEIDKHMATEGMDHHIEYLASKQSISFTTAIGGNISGKIKFYRPSDSSMDFEDDFTLNNEGHFTYPANKLAKGAWKVTFEWKAGNQLMAAEKEIFIE